MLLTECLEPVLRQRFPQMPYFVGHHSGLYWRRVDPPAKGVVVPYWFLVLDVMPSRNGQLRRSYAMWDEGEPPLVVIESVSGDGREERDQTPNEGKFWVYERRVNAGYYVIHDPKQGALEVYQRVATRFEPQAPNAKGHFAIPQLGVALGAWEGNYCGVILPWLRWFDGEGNLLPTAEERAEAAERRAEWERKRADRLAQRLRTVGINPDEI